MARGWWPPPAKPLPVPGGLVTKRRQGTIGESWWSKRFIEVLESFGLANRLARGRSYARKGQVVRLEVHRGAANAVVQGSRARPYRVVIGVDELSDGDWYRVGVAFAAKAVFLAKLLAGEMPQNIEEAFGLCTLSLFPEHLHDLDTVCSCPDVANPCKHIAAALYLLAEAFDDDPFLIFAWRGRTKEELLASLRRVGQLDPLGGGGSKEFGGEGASVDDLTWPQLPADAPVADLIDTFWSCGPGLADVHPRVVASSHPDVLLRQLDPFPELLGNASLVDLLVPACIDVATAAESKAGS